MADMTPISSTNIESAGIEDGDDMPLRVQFRSGGLYAYPGDQSDVEALQRDSKYFFRAIKPRPFRRIA